MTAPVAGPKFRPKDAAKYAGISRSLLDELIARGEIPASKPCPKVVLIESVHLDEWVAAHRREFGPTRVAK